MIQWLAAGLACAGLAGTPSRTAQAQMPPAASQAPRQTEAGTGWTLAFAQLPELVRQRNPQLQVEAAQIDVTAAGVVTAGLLPNPSLSYSALGVAAGSSDTANGSTHQIGISQPLPGGARVRARVHAAQAEVRAATAQVAAVQADLLREARRRFVALLGAQERLRLQQAARDELAALAALVQARAQAGTRSPFDVERLAVEMAALEAEVAGADAAVTAAGGELAEWLGETVRPARAQGALQPLGVGPIDAEVSVGQPAAVAADQAVAAAQARGDLARRERWPTPVVSAGAVVTTDAASLGAFGGLGIDLPLLDRGQGALAAARAEVRAARLQQDAVQRSLRAQAARAGRLLQRWQAALTAFDRSATAKLPRLQQMAEDQYRLGRADLLELLDAQRARTALRLQRVDLVQELILAEIELLWTSGR